MWLLRTVRLIPAWNLNMKWNPGHRERVGSVHIYIYTGPELGATAVRSKVQVRRSPALQWPLSPGRLCLWAPVPLSAKHYTFSASWLGRGGPWWGVNLEYRPPKWLSVVSATWKRLFPNRKGWARSNPAVPNPWHLREHNSGVRYDQL